MQVHSPQRSALLIIDMQVGLFHGPQQPWQGDQVLARITALIGQAREARAPIFALRHTGPQGKDRRPCLPARQDPTQLFL